MPRILTTAAASLLAMTLSASAQAQAPEAPAKNNYADKATWLCWPGRADACAGDNTTTVVQANGRTSVETWKANPRAPVDCFYVYPTVSNDPGIISDMVQNDEEKRVVEQQLSRFGSKCRIYAPLYRQFTLTALRAMAAGRPLPGGVSASAPRPNTGYQDVVDAWNYYLQHENKGRGVVLIGHSQGSGVLTQLIANEIDGKPIQKQLISALLIGTNLEVEKGKDTGVFKNVPLCRSASQTGCAVAYVTFRDTIPPPENSRFGKPRTPISPMEAACVNPAALAGGKAPLHAYLSNNAQITSSSSAQAPWTNDGAKISTPFVSVPGLLTGECVRKNGFNYLEVHVNADPADPRTDEIGGDVSNNGVIAKDWGLHLIDVNVAMGDLVKLVDSQSKAYLAKK